MLDRVDVLEATMENKLPIDKAKQLMTKTFNEQNAETSSSIETLRRDLTAAQSALAEQKMQIQMLQKEVELLRNYALNKPKTSGETL